jgi:hypothetical protein
VVAGRPAGELSAADPGDEDRLEVADARQADVAPQAKEQVWELPARTVRHSELPLLGDSRVRLVMWAAGEGQLVRVSAKLAGHAAVTPNVSAAEPAEFRGQPGGEVVVLEQVVLGQVAQSGFQTMAPVAEPQARQGTPRAARSADAVGRMQAEDAEAPVAMARRKASALPVRAALRWILRPPASELRSGSEEHQGSVPL